MSLENPEDNELRIYWIADSSRGEAIFYQSVKNIEEAIKVLNILAQYDMLRYETGIDIIDYINEAGIEKWNGVEWIEWVDLEHVEVNMEETLVTIH